MSLPVELLLGSQSPRRRALIQLLGFPVYSQAADADEEAINEPDPALNAVMTAELKTAVITSNFSPKPDRRTLLVTADTTVALAGEMLNKPTDEADARRMLMAMKNRTHEVHTGYVVQDMISGKREKGVHTAVVTMRNYSQTEIEAYIATGDPMDKAGAYAIQHPVFRPVRKLEGCFLSVMGLPLCTLLNLFTRFELAVDVDLTAVYQAHHQYPCPILQSRF